MHENNNKQIKNMRFNQGFLGKFETGGTCLHASNQDFGEWYLNTKSLLRYFDVINYRILTSPLIMSLK